MARRKTWVHRALLAAVRGEPPALPAEDDDSWEHLARAATAHGVQGWLARAVRGRPDVPGSFQIPLQASAIRVAASHRRLLDESGRAVSVVRSAGVEVAVLKGPALVERYYDDATLRPYGDVDLLVRPGGFAAALDALRDAGYLLADRNWEFLVEDLRGQVHLTSPTGAVIELHWHVVNGSRQRATLRMGPDELWDAVEPAELGGVVSGVLARPDELAHLLLHSAMHGCDRLGWLTDVRAVTAPADLDWDRVVRRLQRWRFGAGGGHVLALARRLTGAAVPEDVLGALSSGPVARAAAGAAAGRWDLGRPEGASRARELLFATAGDGLGTRAALAADAVVPARGQDPTAGSALVQRATVGAFRRVRGKLFTAGEPEAVAEYASIGDPDEGRRRFLDAVAATVPSERRVILLSPSESIGMSHYTRALARSMERAAEVVVVDAAASDAPAMVVDEWRRGARSRTSTRLLVTSPHWSTPALLRATGWTGGFVWHDPILDAATSSTRPLHVVYYRLLARQLGVVVLHGSVFRRRVQDVGLRPREVVVVPHGFVPDQLVGDDPYDPRGPLVFAGRLHPYKGLDVLLAALAGLGAVNAPEVVVAGHGVTRELVPRKLSTVEVRPGELGDDELRALIGSCSAVLLPYERANQSGVLATAFRFGRPVIASRVGSFAEYVRDGYNGLLVPPGDPAALAAAMTKLRSDPALARRLAAGAARTWEQELAPERSGRAIVDALFR